ncbi:MAG: hypothetical protein GX029_01275 [Pseudomonadaceae bacterium]|nr:hypothetical protein [Pseudomonadaceae bacterium]
MSKIMSLSAPREMLLSIRERYLLAKRTERTKILDGFVAPLNFSKRNSNPTYLI